MRQSQTVVLERNTTVNGGFETEPFEAGWASEARWFVEVLRWSGGEAALELISQVSPDGITWCDGEGEMRQVTDQGLVSWPVREFGQWLRLRARVRGDAAAFQLRIYLAVKS